MHKVPRKCGVRHLILPPAEIHYLRFILEGYEGIGMVTTLDSKLGLVKLSVAPGCEEEIDWILATEKEELKWRAVVLEEDVPSHPTPA